MRAEVNPLLQLGDCRETCPPHLCSPGLELWEWVQVFLACQRQLFYLKVSIFLFEQQRNVSCTKGLWKKWCAIGYCVGCWLSLLVWISGMPMSRVPSPAFRVPLLLP